MISLTLKEDFSISRNPLQENKIPDFVRCVLNGERRAGLQTMDRFSSMTQDENGGNIVTTFPICYIKYFCEQFYILSDHILPLVKSFEEQATLDLTELTHE
jgi:hypothetical protein